MEIDDSLYHSFPILPLVNFGCSLLITGYELLIVGVRRCSQLLLLAIVLLYIIYRRDGIDWTIIMNLLKWLKPNEW